MQTKKDYTPEFKDKAVKFVSEAIGTGELRKRVCDRLALQLCVSPKPDT